MTLVVGQAYFEKPSFAEAEAASQGSLIRVCDEVHSLGVRTPASTALSLNKILCQLLSQFEAMTYLKWSFASISPALFWQK